MSHNSPMPSAIPNPGEGLRIALDLFEAAEELVRQNFRRAFPNATDAEVEKRVQDWLWNRRDAPHGDAPGTPRPWRDPGS